MLFQRGGSRLSLYLGQLPVLRAQCDQQQAPALQQRAPLVMAHLPRPRDRGWVWTLLHYSGPAASGSLVEVDSSQGAQASGRRRPISDMARQPCPPGAGASAFEA